MQRPDERDLLGEVLRELKDLPEGLARRLVEALDGPPEERADALRRAFEELARG
jgi:uncharacterized protein (DUF1778 family)